MNEMREYIEFLRGGEFRIPVCASCSSRVWPPSKICPKCHSNASLQKFEATGILIEFADSHVKNREGSFGIIDMDGIRIVGSLKAANPHVGMKMKMAACGVREDGGPFYDFVTL